MRKEIFKSEGEKIVSTVKMGGFYKWSWKFPFRIFVKERFFVATENCIYEINKQNESNR